MTDQGGKRKMENRSSRSRSRSPISGSDKREGSASPETVSSLTTPMKLSSSQRISVNEEHDPTDRDLLTLDDDMKQIQNNSTTAIISTSHSHKKKRSQHHRHHHHRHKESKSTNKRSSHHRHSVKRSKKEPVSPTDNNNNKSDDGSMSVSEKNTSESEASKSEQDISSSDNESTNEEGVVEANNNTNSPRRNHRRKKHRSSSSIHDTNSQSPRSSPLSIPKNNKGTQLIVNYLPSSLRESDFYQLFARIGPIKLCKLVTDRSTGHSHCYGFIEYQTTEDTLKAIDKFNGYRIEHKKLKVSYAQPKSNNNNNNNDVIEKHSSSSLSSSSQQQQQRNANLYLRDLPDDYDEQTLERLFSKYGEIVKTKVLRDPRTRISRGVAFVLMASSRYADRAVKALDGYTPSSTNIPISVKFADPEKTAAASSKNSSSSSSSRLPNPTSMAAAMGPYGYPPGLPPLGMIDPYYAAAALHHHHRAAMNMRDLSPSPPPPPMPAYYNSGSSRSYDNHTGGGGSSSSRARGSTLGLPRSYSSSSSKHAPLPANPSSSHSHPVGVSSSSRSLNSNKNTNNNNTNPSSSTTATSSTHTAQTLAAACDLIQKGYQQAIDPNGFVIYAFGLPHDCDENDLEELFRRYGDVYRVFIVRNYTTGESKGYSFITMRHYDEASHAIDRLNGSTFKGRTLQVRFKQ